MNWPFPKHEAAQPQQGRALSQPGFGSRLTVNALGHSLGTAPGGATFNHPFRPALSGSRVTFVVGTVASLGGDGPLQPKIQSAGQLMPMSGKDGASPVPLLLTADVANSDGLSWAALEVHPDAASGELLKDSKVEIIHTASPFSHAQGFGRAPLALIIWNGRNPLRVYPLAHFNLRYVRLLPPPGGGVPRHLFL